MKRSVILTILPALSILLVGLLGVSGAGAGPVPDRTFEGTPPLRFDSLHFRAQEAAADLFRRGCLEARVVLLPDREGGVDLVATCTEWHELQPASQ